MILIYGKGKVGSAIASLCDYLGISYEICDDSDSISSFDAYEFIVPSPGIPGTHKVYQTGRILSELDFAYQFLPKDFKIISITGTDGKSTTSWIMYNILEKEYSVKKPVYLSGNFDVPFSGTVLDILRKGEKKGIIVLEVSSFMAFSLENFQSDYSIFTNFKPDHLNWHTSLQEYFDAKMNLFARTKMKSVINYEIYDFVRINHLDMISLENVRIFGMNPELRDSTDGMSIRISGRKKYSLIDTHFSGSHNSMNILSVGIVANEMHICSKKTKKYLSEILGLPHRLEVIGKKNGILIVEDSKSTSSQSLDAALSSFGEKKNILLIAGGSDKGDSFSFLSGKFRQRVKAVACMGATKKHFSLIAHGEQIPYLESDSMEESVDYLYSKGKEGDVLMLSPGCASFGLFRDYLDRANQFRLVVKKLPD